MKTKTAGSATVRVDGTPLSVQANLEVDARVQKLLDYAMALASGDIRVARGLIQASGSLSLIGLGVPELGEWCAETIVQAGNARMMTQAGITAQELMESPRTAAERLAEFQARELENDPEKANQALSDALGALGHRPSDGPGRN